MEAAEMPGTITTQNASTSTPVQVLHDQEASLVKQLATAEASLKSYEKEQSAMSSSERELNILVHQNREQRVVELRGDLDALRQKMADVQAGATAGPEQVVARVQDGPLIVTDAPVTVGTVEAPHFFGLEPRQFREPALFILLLPLILAVSRWIWRRTPARPSRENSLEGNPQISRLEQAVESIAIEVERIGEAQRFSAKLMAERPKEPVIERIRESVKPQRRVVTPLP
jgi:hypothetical protein